MFIARKTQSLIIIAIATFCIAITFIKTSAEVPQTARPNLVFLLADDMGYGDLGCYGSPVIKTPRLDQLAREGVRCTDCYAASPNCSPARAGALTGRMPYRVGMYDFMRANWPMHIQRDETTVAQLLQKAGYNTAFFGKWHLSGYFNDSRHTQPGDLGFDYWLANAKNFDQDPKSLVRNGKPAGPLGGIACEVLSREAIRWLKEDWDRDKPFCLFIWFNEPHTPVRASDSFKEKYVDCEDEAAKIKYGGKDVRHGGSPKLKPTYFGCVSQLDHEIGRVLDTLDTMKLSDSTLVWFTSDNGPEHRPATSWGSPGDLHGAKGHMYDGGIRVPGIMRWPGRIAAGSTTTEPINGTDIMPSFCAAAGVPMKSNKKIDGTNVLPALTGTGKVERPTPMLWWLHHARGGKQVCLRDGDWKILAEMTPRLPLGNSSDARPPSGITAIDFIKKSKLDHFVLYNLREDPNETKEIGAENPEKLAELKKNILALHAEVVAEGPYWELGARKVRKKKGKQRTQ